MLIARLTIALLSLVGGCTATATTPVTKRQHHPSTWVSSPFPNIVNTPALSFKSRRLASFNADGSLPHEPATLDFTGVTARGFIDVHAESLVLNTTVRLADFSNLLVDTTYSCTASHSHKQGGVTLSFTVCTDSTSSYFARRVRVGHVLVLDIAAAATSVSLAHDSSCGTLLDFNSPFYRIDTARTDDMGSYSLELSHVSVSAVVSMLDVIYNWNPDIVGEIAARRASGKPLGDEHALSTFEARRAATYDKTLASININPTKDSLPVFDSQPTALQCVDCFAKFNVGIHATVTMCASGANHYFTTDAGGLGYAAECANLNPNFASFDLALNFDAYFYGSAAYNFEMSSDGFSGPASTCSSTTTSLYDASGAVTPSCLINFFEYEHSQLSEINLGVGGVTVSFTPSFSLSIGAELSGSMPGTLRFGSGASAAVELGGGISFSNLANAANPTLIKHSKFESTYSNVPFVLKGFNTFTGATDLVVVPGLQLALYNILPIAAEPALRYQAVVGSSTTADGSLSNVAAPSCPSEQGPFTLAASASIAGILQSVSLRSIATGMGVPDILSFIFPDNDLWKRTTLFTLELLPQTPIRVGCVPVGSQGITGGSIITPPISAAGNSGANGMNIAGVIGGVLLVLIIIISCTCWKKKNPSQVHPGASQQHHFQQPQMQSYREPPQQRQQVQYSQPQIYGGAPQQQQQVQYSQPQGYGGAPQQQQQVQYSQPQGYGGAPQQQLYFQQGYG
jgi:hypothetical protein